MNEEYNYTKQIEKALWGLAGSLAGMVVAQLLNAPKTAPYTIVGGAIGALTGFYYENQNETKTTPKLT